MSRVAYALLAFNVVAWGFLAWSGLGAMQDIRGQHVAGFPNRGQFDYYALVPLIMLATALIVPLILRRIRLSAAVTPALLVTLALVAPFLFFYTGGM